MDVIKAQQVSSRSIEKVVVHPLVLLSIVDNYNRVARVSGKRVVGVLLGSVHRGVVDVCNSYAGLFSSFFDQIFSLYILFPLLCCFLNCVLFLTK